MAPSAQGPEGGAGLEEVHQAPGRPRVGSPASTARTEDQHEVGLGELLEEVSQPDLPQEPAGTCQQETLVSEGPGDAHEATSRGRLKTGQPSARARLRSPKSGSTTQGKPTLSRSSASARSLP